MFKYTIDYVVPTTVKTGPDFVDWLDNVVDKDSFAALKTHALEEIESSTCVYYGRWKPEPNKVQVVRVYSTRSAATASLKTTKKLYKSTLVHPVFSAVESTTADDFGSINSI